MTTPRPEIKLNNLPRSTRIEGSYELMYRNPVDGRAYLAPTSSLPHPSTQPSSWHTGTTPPPNPNVGTGWYNSDADEFRIWDGNRWILIGPEDLAAIRRLIENETTNRGTAIANEATLREEGDDLQVEEVGTRQRYIDVVALQADSNNPLRMIITADIQVPPASGSGPDQALADGEILEFAPRSNSPEPYRTVNLHWREDQTHVSDTVETETEWNRKTAAHASVHNHLWLRVTKRLTSTIGSERRAREVGELYHIPPRSTVANFIADASGGGPATAAPSIRVSPTNIDIFTDLDGDYTLAAENLDVDSLVAAGVNDWAIWFKQEPVHVAPTNWTPASNLIVNFNINTTEETQIALTAQDRIVPVSLVFNKRESGATTYVSQVDYNGFTVGESSGGTPADTRTPQQIADEIDWEISPGDVYRNGIAGKYTLRYGDLSELGSAVFATVGAGLYSTARTQLTLAGGRLEYEIDATNGGAIADNTDVGASSFPTLINLYTAQTGGVAIATIRRGVGLIRGGVSGSGLDQAQVDARVDALVSDWAEADNTDAIPADKLTNALSNKERLGLMSWEVSPDAIPNNTAGAIQRDYIFSITGSDVVEGDAWIEYVIHGERFPRQAWVKSVGIQSLRLTINAAQAGRIAAQLTERHDMVIEVQFFAQASGGSSYGSRSESVGLSVMTPGISEAEAEALIKQDVHDWAEANNASVIPDAKLGGVEDWSLKSSSDLIPEDKLTNAPGSTRLLYESDPTKPEAPVIGHMLIRWHEGAWRLFTYRGRTLTARSAAFGISDFRWTDGVSRVWRGITSNYLTLSGAADGNVVYQDTKGGRTAGLFTRQGGGWSAVAANHAPADWKYYATLAEANADATAGVGRAILIGEDNSSFVVAGVLGVDWVLYEGEFTQLREYKDQAEAEAATVPDYIVQWWPNA